MEAARLTAITTAAGANLVGQITCAHKLACIGMLDAARPGDAARRRTPGPASLPGLVSDTAAALSIPIALEVDGDPCALDSDAGLMLYRVVQEVFTNVAKHAGRGAGVTVRLAWASGGVEVSVVDRGGDGVDVGLPSSGFRLDQHGRAGRAERRPPARGSLRRRLRGLPVAARTSAARERTS